MDTLYIVVPCYNETEVLPETSCRLRSKLRALMDAGLVSRKSRIFLVDDGSKDDTWRFISDLHQTDGLFCGLKLSRNRGHQTALWAGLMAAKDLCDVAISMDADLQDDIDAVDAMLEKYHAGCDIVYGVRSTRDTDTAFKRMTAEGYYKLIESLGGEVVFNHADYRLMSRRALQSLAQYGESDLFLRGVVPMLGYPTGIVTYARGERFAGESKYPLKKMLQLAIGGITSLSMKPLRAVTSLGVLTLLADFLLLVAYLIFPPLSGYRVVLLVLLLMSGLILLSLGVVGEYVGRTYLETKHRPRYFIDQLLTDD